MPAPPVKLSSPAADLWRSTGRCARQSLRECSAPENKAVEGECGSRLLLLGLWGMDA